MEWDLCLCSLLKKDNIQCCFSFSLLAMFANGRCCFSYLILLQFATVCSSKKNLGVQKGSVKLLEEWRKVFWKHASQRREYNSDIHMFMPTLQNEMFSADEGQITAHQKYLNLFMLFILFEMFSFTCTTNLSVLKHIFILCKLYVLGFLFIRFYSLGFSVIY